MMLSTPEYVIKAEVAFHRERARAAIATSARRREARRTRQLAASRRAATPVPRHRLVAGN